MTNEKICTDLINALQKEGYNDSTIYNYHGMIRRFHEFCSLHGVTEYTPAIGNLYANDVISKKTGSFSLNRYHNQGRFIRLLDSFDSTGSFDFATTSRIKQVPANPDHHKIYGQYQEYLRRIYQNDNTIHYYEYGLFYFLEFMDTIKLYNTDLISPKVLIQYISVSEPNRQRAVLCGLRSFCRYLGRQDLINSIAGIHSMRVKRVIPALTEKEMDSLVELIESGIMFLRDTAIVLLGLSCGIRACDLTNLKLSDIDWNLETISFRQSKTGNYVCLPLIPIVGNAIFRYITEARPNADNDYLFVRELAPYTPLSGHSSCYYIIKKTLRKAGIMKDGRIFGMHLLRHNAASTMVKNAVPVETIAAVLGHSSPEATDVYITMDTVNLRECVLPMGAISREVNA
jgi:integrase